MAGLCLARVSVFLLLASVASGESGVASYDGELERWVFSGALEVGLYGDSAEAEFDSTPLVGPRATNLSEADDAATVVRGKADSSDVLSGLVGGNFEVMTPAHLAAPGRPRLFMDISLLGVLASEASIARIGDPGEFGVPDGISPTAPFVGELILRGHGTEVTSQHQGFQLHVGLGPAFTFDFGEDRIRIKPSLVYSRTETKVSAVAKRAVRIVNQDPRVDGRFVRSLDSYRLIDLQDEFTEVYHGLGPALEIEYDTNNRIGPFMVSVYLKGAASHLFGDLETEFEASNPDEPSETVRWKFENERWVYRASTGLRFRLVPRR